VRCCITAGDVALAVTSIVLFGGLVNHHQRPQLMCLHSERGQLCGHFFESLVIEFARNIAVLLTRRRWQSELKRTKGTKTRFVLIHDKLNVNRISFLDLCFEPSGVLPLYSGF
jgi:hypothetical protein